LVTDHQTGKLRESSFWSNIGKATMTGAFITQSYRGTLTEWYVLAYGSLVVCHELASRYFNQKQQLIDKDAK
jgi:hypothetical protein